MADALEMERERAQIARGELAGAAAAEAGQEHTQEPEDSGPGIYLDLGALPPSTVVTEDGLAGLLGKACRDSIKRAVARGELPPPVKIMGKNAWTVGYLVRFFEDRLEAEAKKFARLRPSA